jgi:hypothetical protein
MNSVPSQRKFLCFSFTKQDHICIWVSNLFVWSYLIGLFNVHVQVSSSDANLRFRLKNNLMNCLETNSFFVASNLRKSQRRFNLSPNF